ncbi:MAG: hypothetical protein ABIK27_01740 [Bacteroidota bacterium]
MSDIIIAFITGAVVAGISSYLAHFYSVHRDKRKEFNDAAKEFRSNFTNELKLLKRFAMGDDVGKTTEHILADAIERHESAMIDFGPYLNESKKIGFDEAWKNYALDDNGGLETPPDKAIHKYYSYENTTLEMKMRKLAIKSIEWLLVFTKPK